MKAIENKNYDKINNFDIDIKLSATIIFYQYYRKKGVSFKSLFTKPVLILKLRIGSCKNFNLKVYELHWKWGQLIGWYKRDLEPVFTLWKCIKIRRNLISSDLFWCWNGLKWTENSVDYWSDLGRKEHAFTILLPLVVKLRWWNFSREDSKLLEKVFSADYFTKLFSGIIFKSVLQKKMIVIQQ